VEIIFITKIVISIYIKNHVLAGPVQGLFAAYRIALSMVAGVTRRRRLNIVQYHITKGIRPNGYGSKPHQVKPEIAGIAGCSSHFIIGFDPAPTGKWTWMGK